MTKHKRFFLTAFLAVALIGCSAAGDASSSAGDGVSSVSDGSLVAASDEGVDPPGDEDSVNSVDVDAIEQLWLSAGADSGLASCYAEVLREAEVGSVVDLNDLQSAMASLDSDAQSSINACVAGS